MLQWFNAIFQWSSAWPIRLTQWKFSKTYYNKIGSSRCSSATEWHSTIHRQTINVTNNRHTHTRKKNKIKKERKKKMNNPNRISLYRAYTTYGARTIWHHDFRSNGKNPKANRSNFGLRQCRRFDTRHRVADGFSAKLTNGSHTHAHMHRSIIILASVAYLYASFSVNERKHDVFTLQSMQLGGCWMRSHSCMSAVVYMA